MLPIFNLSAIGRKNKDVTILTSKTLIVSFFLVVLAACSHKSRISGDWPYYSGDLTSSKHFKSGNINQNNFKNLEVIWRWSSPDNETLKKNKGLFVGYNENTPLAIEGNLYTSTSLNSVAKIDGKSGKTLWLFQPKQNLKEIPSNVGFIHRGVSYWKNPDTMQELIFFASNNAYLYAIDVDSGKLVKSFGNNGTVDLLKDIDSKGNHWKVRREYGTTSPPLICNGVVIVGSSINDFEEGQLVAPGTVRAFDAKSGKLVWRFNTVPQKGEFGTSTWNKNSWKSSGHANVWTYMSADEKNGLVYLPTSSTTNDFFGGDRPGDNLFAESIVCLSCKSGKRKWHFQVTKHGLWDYDLPAAANLFEANKDGQKIPALAQITKQNHLFVLNRLTGEPLWPIEEKMVPKSQVEKSSPTQIFPKRPPPFGRQGISERDLLDFTPELKKKTLKIVNQYNYGPLYTPPSASKKGTLTLPGRNGGASWSGSALNGKDNTIYIPFIAWPSVNKLRPSKNFSRKWFMDFTADKVTDLNGNRYSYPVIKPPYGSLTAIDLNSGQIKWKTPVGKGPKEQLKKYLKNTEWESKNMGWPRRSHILLLDDVLVLGQSGMYIIERMKKNKSTIKLKLTEAPDEQNLKAFDPKTGQLISEIPLNRGPNGQLLKGQSGNAYGAPMSYLDNMGRQIIVVPVGGANLPAELVALSL